MINKPGYYDIPMPDYLSDPCPSPSLSTGAVVDLIQTTPKRAHYNHPRYGKNASDITSRGEIGTAVHSLLLGGAPVLYAPPEFEDWKKKDAQTFRNNARASGAVALLASQEEPVMRAVATAREYLAGFGAGKSEQTMLYTLGDVWCRGRADFLTDDGEYDIDIKTVDEADPGEWIRRAVQSNGYDVQAALRAIGHETLTGKPRKMVWLLVELDGVDCSVCGPDPSMLDLAKRKVMHAAKIWGECQASNKWPGYGQQIRWAQVQAFAERDFAERSGVAP